MHNDAIVCFVDEMGAAADVIEVGGLAPPVLQLTRVRNQPHMHLMVLGKALDLGQHLAHVLCLCHVGWPLVIELIVWVNDQSPDAKPEQRTRAS